MKQTADVVIIGGGVIGCSLLYNLAQLGTTNCLLLEMDVLASGSTGRSQAICRMHYSNPVTASMAWESVKIFANFGDAVGGLVDGARAVFEERGMRRRFILGPGGHHHLSASISERQGHSPADAPAATGHDGHFASKFSRSGHAHSVGPNAGLLGQGANT